MKCVRHVSIPLVLLHFHAAYSKVNDAEYRQECHEEEQEQAPLRQINPLVVICVTCCLCLLSPVQPK